MNKNGPNRVLTPQVLQRDQFGKKINFPGTLISFVFDIKLNPLIGLMNYPLHLSKLASLLFKVYLVNNRGKY